MSAPKQDNRNSRSDDENFISRWSRRKQEAVQQDVLQQETSATEEIAEKPLLTDADMPAIDSLTEDSDYSGFFSPKVSEALRKQALRKLFHSPMFNIRDGLDDYDGIYTEFEKLGDIVTADIRHQMEMEAERHARQLAEADSASDDATDEKHQAKQVTTETQTSNISSEPDDFGTDVELAHDIDELEDAEVES